MLRQFLYIFGVNLVLGLNITTNVIKNNNDCYSPSDEYIFVNSMEDLNILHKCKNLNGSLFINGGNNINSLEKLEHLESITGNLVILDSHILDNLYGLHNLKEIKGENLYLDNYGVTIRHNNNYMNDSHHGLCYIDNIKWDNITTTDKWFENNGNNCPECDINCLDCWGIGPRNCHVCAHVMSGNTCIDKCPLGTTLTNNICLETNPSIPNLHSYTNNYNNYISWDEPLPPNGVITGYDLFRDDLLIHSERIGLNNQLKLNFTDHYLLPYTNYFYQIKAINHYGESDLSPKLIQLTDQGCPSTPNNITIENITHNSIALLWDEPSKLNGIISDYHIKLVDNNDKIQLSSSNTYLDIGKLDAYTNYSLSIRAHTNKCKGNFSIPKYFTTFNWYPTKPLFISAKNITNTSVKITWDESLYPNGIITNYEYIIFNNNSQFNQTCYDYYAHTYNLSPFTQYFVKVRALNSKGFGEYSDIFTFNTLEGIPTEPINVEIRSESPTKVLFKWSDPKDLNGNIIKFQYQLINTLDENYNLNGTIVSNNITLNLEPFNNYLFRVNACTHTGCGKYSNWSDFTTLEGIPNIPTNIHLDGINYNSVLLNWEHPYPTNGIIQHYEYELWNNLNMIGNHNITNKLYNNITNLQPNTNYLFRIRAYTNYNHGEYSQLFKFKTDEFIPTTPPIIGLHPYNTSIEVLFVKPIESNGNIIYYKYLFLLDGDLLITNTISAKKTNFTISNLLPYRNYSIYAMAATKIGHGPSTIRYINTTIGIPPKPLPPIVVQYSNHTLSLNIKPVSNINGPISKYQIMLYNNSETNILYEGDYKNTLIINDFKPLINMEYQFKLTTYTSEEYYSESVLSKTFKYTKSKHTNDNDNDNDNDDKNNKILLGLLILFGIILLSALLFSCYVIYNRRKNQQLQVLSRLTGRYNNGVDSTVGNEIVYTSYENPVYEQNTFEDLKENAPNLVPANMLY